jgi:hypothetical protein
MVYILKKEIYLRIRNSDNCLFTGTSGCLRQRVTFFPKKAVGLSGPRLQYVVHAILNRQLFGFTHSLEVKIES